MTFTAVRSPPRQPRVVARGAVAVVWMLLVGACGSDDASTSPQADGLVVEDLADEVGLSSVSLTHGEPCVADFDGDDVLDILLSTHSSGEWEFYRGLSDGQFERDHVGTFVDRDRHGCAVADFDSDGRLDIYASIGGCKGACEGDKELWMQQPDGSFVDESAPWGVADPGGRGRVPVAFDADNDGLPDLFAGNGIGVDFPSSNLLWINTGANFRLHDGPPTEEIGNHCASAGDIDDDGWIDLAVCSEEGFRVYRNDEGTFTDVLADLDIGTFGRRDAEMADLTGDGLPELILVTKGVVEVHINSRSGFDGAFRHPLEDGRHVAVGDANGDGAYDLYVVQGTNAEFADLVLLNDGTGENFALGPDIPNVGGAGDTAAAIPDWDGSGRDAFVVTNGAGEVEGPRQFIVFDDR